MSRRIYGLCAAIALFSGQNAHAQTEELRVLFVNRHSVPLRSLQIAPANSRAWQANLLSQPLANGEEIPVVVTRDRNACNLDIKATFSNGSTQEDYAVDLCGNDIYTFVALKALW